MGICEEKVLLSADRYGRVAIVKRADGLYCLYRHGHWTPGTQSSFGIEPVEDRRWTTAYDPRLYDEVDPLPGIYGTVEDAEAEARRLLGLDIAEHPAKTIVLDGSSWQSTTDFFAALLPCLGAPAWHGHNLDALDDSLYGGINKVEPPFTVIVRGAEKLPADMASFLAKVSTVFADAREQYGVEVRFELI